MIRNIEKIFKNDASAFYMLSIINGIVPIFLVPIAARSFTSNDFGLYLLYFSIINVFSMIVDFGFSLSGLRALAQGVHSERDYISSTVHIKFFIFLFSTFLFLIFSFWNASLSWLDIVIIITSYFFCGMDYVWYLQAKKRISLIIKKILFLNLLYVTLSIPVMFVFKSYQIAFVVYLLYRITYFSFITKNVLLLCPIKYGIDLPTLKKTFFNSIGIFIFRLFTFSYTVGNGILLGAMTNTVQVAYFLGLEKINKIILFVFTPISHALMPFFSTSKSKKNKSFANSAYFYFVIFFSFVVVFLINLLSSDIIGCFLGEEYINNYSKSLLFFMTLSIPSILTSNAIGMLYIIPMKLDKSFNFVIISVAILNFILCLVFLRPDSGALQMAKILALSEFLVLALLFIIMMMDYRNER